MGAIGHSENLFAVPNGLQPWEFIAAPKAVVEKARLDIERFAMLQDGDGVLVGVSGGADSTTLLHVLSELAKKHDYHLHVAHVNHGLRGDESDAEEEYTNELCGRLGVSCSVRKLDVAALAKEWKRSIPQAGRRARYEFFEEIAENQDCTRVAMGHTADDVVETVLMNLFRGTGIEGLTGIPPVSEGWIVRPLIGCFRVETLAYAQIHGLNPCEDSSNEDTNQLRNWMRLRMLPLLQGRFAGDVRYSVLRLVELVRDENEVLNQTAQERFDEIATNGADGSIQLDREACLIEPKGVQRRLMRLALERLRGPLHGVSAEQVERMLDLAATCDGRAEWHLPQKLMIHVEDKFLVVLERKLSGVEADARVTMRSG